MTTKLILAHDVPHLGSADEVMEVKDGYAHNCLLSCEPATLQTKDAQHQIGQITRTRHKCPIESLEHAQTACA